MNNLQRLPCERCGMLEKVQKHHIVHRVNGGSNKPENIRPLCLACHDYQHAKEKIVKALNIEKQRVEILERRLKSLESRNTPELIREKGYQSYLFEGMLPGLKGCREVFTHE